MTTATELATHIQQIPLCDTHEHMVPEADYVEQKPGILENLFQSYVPSDFLTAGLDPEALNGLVSPEDPDVRARFKAVEKAWQALRHTGYGEAVRLSARHVYGIEEITCDSLEAASDKNEALVQPGARLHILKEIANLDHIQTDNFCWPCPPDPSGPDFFFTDLSWAGFCGGALDLASIDQETGVTVRNLDELREAMSAIFAAHAPTAIAVKSQHAYGRTLHWEERNDSDAEHVLRKLIAYPDQVTEAERLCLGDWCWARGCELCAEHDLPFKLHTGYYAGNNNMATERIPAGKLNPLLQKYPDTRFVLMHIAYPYNDELVGVAKQYTNVYVDMCWAWSIDPYSSCDFVRRFIHAVPANKLFAFGGDTGRPVGSVGYAFQARNWLTRALQGEVDDGLLTEKDAIEFATRVMRDNQYDCFRLEAKRAAATAALEPAPA